VRRWLEANSIAFDSQQVIPAVRPCQQEAGTASRPTQLRYPNGQAAIRGTHIQGWAATWSRLLPGSNWTSLNPNRRNR